MADEVLKRKVAELERKLRDLTSQRLALPSFAMRSSPQLLVAFPRGMQALDSGAKHHAQR